MQKQRPAREPLGEFVQEHADPEIVYAGIVRDQRQILCAFPAQSGDQIFWNATKTEAAKQNGGAIMNRRNCGIGIGYALIPLYHLSESQTQNAT